MKTTIFINGEETEISLTQAQIQSIVDASQKKVSKDNVISLEDGLQITGESLESFIRRTQFDDEYERTEKELAVMVKAINPEGWKPDFEDHDQRKYFPRHKFGPSGFGFSYGDWTYSSSGTTVGSRLLFATAELAEYAGKTWIEKYKILQTK